jgi:dephospho-CoA kinase
MTKIVGLTGGIGSGKSTIAKHFESLGIPIYIADDEARKLTNSLEILSKIEIVFGKSVFDNDVLNRKKLGEIVFQNPKKLAQLNAIIHPAVQLHFDNWLTKHSNHKFIIKESAILFENGTNKKCDYVITVVATLENRIKRVLKRDNMSREEVLLRVNNQWTDQKKIEKSDFIINNNILEVAIIETNSIAKKIINLTN